MPRELREPDLPRTAKVRDRALRTGWTTGACSAAAAKAAAQVLAGADDALNSNPVVEVEITLPKGQVVRFPVERVDGGERWAEAVVVKDAGDDPDVTHGAHLTVRLERTVEPGIAFAAGEGVGTVTKPGLGLEVGGPAINPMPRRMIEQAVREVLDLAAAGVRCTISVPGGEKMARKTTNRRLGILGGISILGTTGIVRPFSTASWRASVEQAVDVAAAQGHPTIVLSTGGRTERAAMRLLPDLDEVCFIEVGDFTGAALRRMVERGIGRCAFVGMAGKLTKLGAGVFMTHYTRSKVDLSYLAEITRAVGGDDPLAAEVAQANTARHVYELWTAAGLVGPGGALLCTEVAANMRRFSEDRIAAEAAMVDFDTLDLVAASPGFAALAAAHAGGEPPKVEEGEPG